jgi:transposase InsO family protein
MVLGPKKIQALLAGEFEHVPSKTTVYNILRAEGQISPRRRRRRVPGFDQPFAAVTEPNDVWTVDFKGQFRLGDKRWCYPLTVMDLHSRYLLACQAQPRIATPTVRQHFEGLFRRHGLPRRIRSDNGPPFASRAVGGLSRLSVWWLKLGILPERIQPGQPQQNGAHERMHETLKQAATQPGSRHLAAQQRRFDRFRHAYNERRPHEALSQQMPASRYRSSPRPFPRRLSELCYPDWFETKRVGSCGLICLANRQIYVSSTLAAERVGLEQTAETVYDVYFGPLRLGAFDLKQAEKRKAGPGYLSLKV